MKQSGDLFHSRVVRKDSPASTRVAMSRADFCENLLPLASTIHFHGKCEIIKIHLIARFALP